MKKHTNMYYGRGYMDAIEDARAALADGGNVDDVLLMLEKKLKGRMENQWRTFATKTRR